MTRKSDHELRQARAWERIAEAAERATAALEAFAEGMEAMSKPLKVEMPAGKPQMFSTPAPQFVTSPRPAADGSGPDGYPDDEVEPLGADEDG